MAKSNPNMILVLAKVIIAAAWVDGNVSHEEINDLKDLLFRLPDITGREWAMLEMYIEAPVGESERARLVEQLRAEIRSGSDKALALAALDDLTHVDGQVSPEEEAVLADIKEAIQFADVGLVSALSGVVQGMVRRREKALAHAPNREEHFEDFIKNKVFYGVRRRLELGEADLDIPDTELRRLSLAGGLMARLAHVDREVHADEVNTMVNALQKNWGLAEKEATFVAQTAVEEVSYDMDYYRLTREFFTSTSREELVKFLDVLFDVAAADGQVLLEETEEIRTIARSLKLEHEEFIAAKLKIPRERRSD